jgi:hypothetical protein
MPPTFVPRRGPSCVASAIVAAVRWVAVLSRGKSRIKAALLRTDSVDREDQSPWISSGVETETGFIARPEGRRKGSAM